MNDEEIKQEALRRYCNRAIAGLPLEWVDVTVDRMLKEKQDETVENIKDVICFIIDEKNNQKCI